MQTHRGEGGSVEEEDCRLRLGTDQTSSYQNGVGSVRVEVSCDLVKLHPSAAGMIDH